jgi:Tol biopolymer transport system component
MKLQRLLIIAAVLILSACSQSANTTPQVQSSSQCPRVAASDLHWLSDTQLAYVYPSITGDVYSVDVNTGENTLLIELPDIDRYRFMWSPDGKYLLLDEGNGSWIVVDKTGNTVTAISNVMYESAWSSDSTRIAYIEDGTDIISINRDGSERQQIFSGHETEITPVSVLWSPDGDYIASLAEDFSDEWKPNGSVLLVMRPDGTELRQFQTEYLQPPFLLSPDGRWLATGIGNEPFALIEMASGDRQTIVNDYAMPLMWLPDSSGILLNLTYSSQIARASLDGSTTVIGAMHSWLAISPDTSMIAYVEGQSSSDPTPDIYLANIDSSDARILVHNPAPTVCLNQ